MRRWVCLVLLLLTAACHKAADAPTATNLDDINLGDTVEDPAYAAPGEALARTVSASAIGEMVPVVSMQTIDGDTIDLGEIYGNKPVYIKFWATWCVPCRQQTPAFEKAYQTYGDKLEVIALNIGLSDDEASVRKFRDMYGMTMPIVMDDGHLAQLFDLRVTPQHVLIGKDARIAYIGHAENQALADAIARVVNQQGSADVQLAPMQPAATVFKIGDTITGLELTTSSGVRFPLRGDGPERIRAVVFFSSWCEWYLEKTRPGTARACARVREEIEELARQASNIDWLGVAGGPWSTAEDLADYQNNNKVSIPIGLDVSGTLFRALDVRDIPTVVLIDGAGKVLQVIGPEIDLKDAIARDT